MKLRGGFSHAQMLRDYLVRMALKHMKNQLFLAERKRSISKSADYVGHRLTLSL